MVVWPRSLGIGHSDGGDVRPTKIMDYDISYQALVKPCRTHNEKYVLLYITYDGQLTKSGWASP